MPTASSRSHNDSVIFLFTALITGAKFCQVFGPNFCFFSPKVFQVNATATGFIPVMHATILHGTSHPRLRKPKEMPLTLPV